MDKKVKLEIVSAPEYGDFADAPQSVAERRAEMGNDGTAWTPREALVSALRSIDRGEIAPTGVVIVLQEKHEGVCNACFSAAGEMSSDERLGLIERIKIMMTLEEMGR